MTPIDPVQLSPACHALNRDKLAFASTAGGATRAVQGRSGGGAATAEVKPATGPLSFSLPYPPAALSPNSRLGWRKKIAVIKRYRRDCGYAARSALGPRVQAFAAPMIDLTFCSRTAHARDVDNHIAMMKAAMDGLTDIGLWADDCRVRWGVVAFEKTAGQPEVRVTVREEEQPAPQVAQGAGG